MRESSGFEQASQEVEVLKQRKGTKTSDRIINSTADKNTGVSVTESQVAQQGINGGELPGGTRRPVKQQPEIAGCN